MTKQVGRGMKMEGTEGGKAESELGGGKQGLADEEWDLTLSHESLEVPIFVSICKKSKGTSDFNFSESLLP